MTVIFPFGFNFKSFSEKYILITFKKILYFFKINKENMLIQFNSLKIFIVTNINFIENFNQILRLKDI